MQVDHAGHHKDIGGGAEVQARERYAVGQQKREDDDDVSGEKVSEYVGRVGRRRLFFA
ncbi:hypothetical protein SDC9_98526 [bioreactor metagenome]|uniref:Uncharacterized protein n=1 Tax=bioreactor metagenome TaxID=1076179 RepID=A0A645AEY9_9ZZZZ